MTIELDDESDDDLPYYSASEWTYPYPPDLSSGETEEVLDDREAPGGKRYIAELEYGPRPEYGHGHKYGHGRMAFEVTAEQYRIISEYEDARDNQEQAEAAAAAARWAPPPPPPPPREPEPEEIPPEGKLTPRQEEFCRHYAAQPVATRAAVLAGYSDNNASPYGSRLLNNPLVLERIAKYRAERQLHYVVERDTLHDKLEALYFGALGERNHAAAVSVLKLQAALAGMFARLAPQPHDGAGRAAAARDNAKSQGRSAKKPGKAKVQARRKPGKAKVGARQKPGKAKESQRKPR